MEMKKSFEHVRRIHAKEGDASVGEIVQMFGAPATRRRVFTAMLSHLHANLGQAIAYARMNGVVPPWSR